MLRDIFKSMCRQAGMQLYITSWEQGSHEDAHIVTEWKLFHVNPPEGWYAERSLMGFSDEDLMTLWAGGHIQTTESLRLINTRFFRYVNGWNKDEVVAIYTIDGPRKGYREVSWGEIRQLPMEIIEMIADGEIIAHYMPVTYSESIGQKSYHAHIGGGYFTKVSSH